MSSLRVVLGEDSYLTREGITRVLDGIEGVDLVGAGGDLDALRATIELERPDVVLTDIRMPPTHTDEGIRLAAELRAARPEIGVVVLSHHSEPLYALELFAGGSDGRAYLLKERLTVASELERALRAVATGGSIVDPRVVDDLLTERSRAQDSLLDRLTPREREILALIAEGRSNNAIASALAITKRGVERHINTIFWKLELGNSEDISRRVKAALLFLAGDRG